ncbi:hypothetical protein [Massilia sp. YMA4]|uniref:Uncharacterized protein n=1 Tax=[Empedobacter] haloabium TaxID=592317 RepID=A0ABZ1UQD0_9BURK|nr:hypothetical protein [Massilia sp. YMA4]
MRRREDKPEEYLVYETQRRWLIWQAALEHGKTPAARKAAAKEAGEKAVGARAGVQRAPVMGADEAAVRNQVLNEVIDAFSGLNGTTAMEDIVNVIQGLKQKQKSDSGE